MNLDDRALVHAALGDPLRLTMVDRLMLTDHTFKDLSAAAGLPGNLAAHHLDVLEAAGLIERRVSEGDRRRRYIRLRHEMLDGLVATPDVSPGFVLFVCTHNSARSQFAAALWSRRTGEPAHSAGSEPADRVHPMAIRAAAEFDLDLSRAVPKGYDRIAGPLDLIVSVCDRALESGIPFNARAVHWSVPDPVRIGTADAFRSAFADLADRVDRLASKAH